jgi:hypothetical protein
MEWYWQLNTLRKTWPSTTFYTTNFTWRDLGLNPGLRDKRPASDDVGHGRAFNWSRFKRTCHSARLRSRWCQSVPSHHLRVNKKVTGASTQFCVWQPLSLSQNLNFRHRFSNFQRMCGWEWRWIITKALFCYCLKLDKLLKVDPERIIVWLTSVSAYKFLVYDTNYTNVLWSNLFL